LDLLGEDVNDLATPQEGETSPEALAALQRKYLHASPEVKERISRYIERGSVGAMLKKYLGYKCQVAKSASSMTRLSACDDQSSIRSKSQKRFLANWLASSLLRASSKLRWITVA
jgi:hypothetical protein